LRTLENAIQFGQPVLMQEVEEELDPALEPIMSRAIVKVGNRSIMKLGDKEVDYNPEFRFYLTTKLANPHYTPEISTKATICNFCVKQQGLEDQLLGTVVRKERPELEQQKNELVVAVAAGKRKLKLPDAASDMFAPMRALLASEMKTLQEVAVKLKAKVREEEKDKYAAAAEADKAKVKTAFGPECASKLQDIVDNLHDTAASRDYEEHLGLSVATYFKVQCYNGLPVGAKDCDKSAVELYKLVDSGNSLYNKTAHEEAKAAAEEGAEEFLQKNMTNAEAKAAKTPESGEKWCESFFDVFFDAVVAAQSEGEEKAEFVQTFQNDKEKAAWFKKFWKGPDCECIGKTQGPDCECIGAKPKTVQQKSAIKKALRASTK
jgi:hypothetical protein